jgi:hypothetical protein
MQYLGLALYAEGRTDYYFLSPLLQRLCEDVCAGEALQPVEVSDVIGLDHPPSVNNANREQRIVSAAGTARGAWKILFVHADGAGNPQRVRAQQVEPALASLRSVFGNDGVGVAVVPIRETEAWVIADGDAIRHVFDTQRTDSELGLPSPSRAAESVADPKASLDSAFAVTEPSGRRRKQGVSPYLSALGEQVSLTRLRELDAFLALEAELKAALRQLGIMQ